MLEAVALGAATRDEDRRVRAHAAGCAECARALSALEESSALIGLAAPDVPAPGLAAVRARLLRRIADESQARPSSGASASASAAAGAPSPEVAPARTDAQPSRSRSTVWALAASIAFITTAAFLVRAEQARSRAEAALAEGSAAARNEIAALRDSLETRESVIAGLTGPSVQVVTMSSTDRRDPRGRMFWDQLAGRWTLVAHDLPALPSGRTYQLWVITTTGERVSAGTFVPAAGATIVRATYALARDQLAAVAVTLEPDGGVPQPTGPVIIAGTPS